MSKTAAMFGAAGAVLLSLSACRCGTCGDAPEGFVQLAEAVPDAILEIRYYSTYNFVGDRIRGYERPTALLTREAAAALKAASDELKEQGYRLKIYDAYRPRRAVAHFAEWAYTGGAVPARAHCSPKAG